MNGYRVHLTRLAGGFDETVTRGVLPDLTEPVQVADEFDFEWSFVDEFAPNAMEPSTITFNLVARTAADLPPLDPGDLWEVRLDLVDITDDVVTVLATDAIEFVGRLGEPEVTLVPTHAWPVRVRLTLADLLADLRSRFPQSGPWDDGYGQGSGYASDWLPRWAENLAKINLWFPTRYATDSELGFFLAGLEVPDTSAFNQLAAVAAAWPDKDGHLATVRWRYSTTPPDPSTYSPGGWAGYGGDFPDLTNPVGYVLQYVDRRMPDGATLPYQLTGPAAGPISLDMTAEPATASGIALLSGCHVTIPTTARRSRDQQPNTIVLNGIQRVWQAEDTPLGYSWEYSDTTMTITTDADRPRSKSFDTLSWLRSVDPDGINFPDNHDNELTRQRLEAAYLPDEAALLDDWVYDRITVDPQQMTTAEYAALVPLLVSHSPDQGDGVAQRQVLIVDVDPDVDLSGRGRIAGRLVAGTTRISRGRLTYELQLAPGVLEPGDTGITASQLAAGPYSTSPATAFADLTALDMRLVRA